MEMLVCSSNCHPTLGFLDSDQLSSPTTSAHPSDAQFVLVGDAFQPNESLSFVLGGLPWPFPSSLSLPFDIDTDGAGRFEFDLTLMGFGLETGDYTIKVEGQSSADSASASFTLTNDENL